MMKKLAVFLKGYRKECVLGPLFKLLEATLELLVPLVIAAIVDGGIHGGNRPYVVQMCLVLAALGLVGLAFSVTAQYFAARAAVGCSTRMRHALFAHVGTLSHTELDTLGTSTLITRMTGDVNQVQSGLNLTLRLLLRSPFVVFGAMIMAFTVNARAAVTFAVVIPALSVVVFGIMLLSLPLYRKLRERLDLLTVSTRENLDGARVIRAFRKEKAEEEKFRARNDSLTAMQNFVGRISALLGPLTYILINLAVIWLLRIGAVRVDGGDMTQGELIALYNYMAQILVELIKLANLIITITKSVACANRICAVLDTPSSLADGITEVQETDCPYAVEFRHATLRYRGAGAPALTDIDFTVRRGETVGIIGGTGSGKSSLVHLIPRFYDVEEGAVLVNGTDVRDMPLIPLRESVGIVPQKAVLFAGTVRDNMRWGDGSATDEDIEEALQIAQAKGVVEDKGGLDARVEAGGRNFSGGQRQRLTIARALVRKPQILILDDSASALDYATDAALRRALQETQKGRTVFIVSQRASSVMHADKIVVLEDGHIAGIGRHEELLSGCDIYREIYETQFGGGEGSSAG